MLAHSAPRIVEYEISRKGVRIADTLYTYSNLESFWIIDEDGYERDRILLKSKKVLVPLIVLPLGDAVDIEEVSEFLSQYLDEEEMAEPLSEHLMHWLGF